MRTQTVNSTVAVTDIHPCYEMDNLNHVLTYSPSVICTLFYIFLVFLSVITVGGNLLVTISVIYFKQLHTPTNYLILSLAIADLLVGIVVFPFSMVFSVSSCLYNETIFCRVRGSFDIWLSTCSILNLCGISIDRYYAVCQPLMYRAKITHNVIVCMILVSWVVSALIGIGVIVGGIDNEGCEEGCLIDILTSTIGSALSFYLPVIIMLCIYMKIYLVARKQARNIQILKSGATLSKIEMKATKTLSIVLGVFLLCWTPFFLCITLSAVNDLSVPVSVTETLKALALSNSTLNPFIYAFFYSWFRATFRIIIIGKIFQGDCSNLKLH
ncbi:trace amine-associated receptor 1-like [Nelusetta ayraudi]|uniref:trace amine-associated receptor 1-like n=1 Tax=Nelusetta ayraudi TaxID=303726 RepID=UPI003F70FAB8